MGASSRQMPTRRRTTSMDMEFPPSVPAVQSQQQSSRGGYKSDTSRRRSINNNNTVNRKLNQDVLQYNTNTNNNGNNNNNNTNRQMMRRRSTGFYESETTTATMQQPSPNHKPKTRQFQSDQEDASDHSSYIDPEEHDSQSSSNPPLEDGVGHNNNKNPNHPIHQNNNQHNHSIYNSITPIGTRRIRSNGNKSDPELGSNSVHKRAMHEAGLTASVLRGSNNNKGDVLQNNNNNNTTIEDSRRPILRTSSEGSESSFPNNHNNDDSNKSRISALDNNNNNHLQVSRGNDEPPILRTNFKLTERILTSKVWRIFQTKNPIFLLLLTGVSMMGVGLYTQSYATLSVTLDQVILREHQRRQTVEGHFETIERDMNQLQRQLLELHPDASLLLSGEHIHNNDDEKEDTETPTRYHAESSSNTGTGVFDEIVAVKERIRLESSRISAFEKHIQATSLRDATRKYGTGVIRVELTLDFLSDRTNALLETYSSANNQQESSAQQQPQHTLVLEMAPLEVMPHSVYTFLEMVDHHLLDGCSFILNAMNIIKAAPLPYDKTDKTKTAKQMDLNFRKLGLETVSFREYNESYPHEEYTIGFAADGGPDFYINTGDNTQEHIGEPCFARIVSGFETVTKMKAEPLRSGMWIKKRIGIQKATVL